MNKKIIASVLGLSVLVGGFSAASGSASTEELVKADDKVFVESIENNEGSPRWAPAVVVAGKVAAKAAGAGFAAAAGAWAFDKVTGIFKVQENLDYQETKQVFDQ
ncbi:hypothetical protein LAV72_11905 [Lysinibacillus xylanilyticus]|uniref:hypothetical protein n=1 Tax=Lysinibacillus xylanilyticus TaxID=582475 RepID=UPI002B2534D7|nr:hypothetical protein [Lysinibacillus xylanilyticus]MEB2300319.1 hypothetical protein [Lysinibacillus xylanilyticus]